MDVKRAFNVKILLYLTLICCGEVRVVTANSCPHNDTPCGVDTAYVDNTASLPDCPDHPLTAGKYSPYVEPPSRTEVSTTYQQVQTGGRWRPAHCRARSSVAILVPYRNRAENLELFLPNLHTFLQLQQLEYGIYLIEQADSKNFNRGSLLNAGFLHSLEDMAYDCIVLHDVDKYPEDTRNSYACADGEARHLIAQIHYPNQRMRKIPYDTYFGGVTLLPANVFRKINGFSNRFFGWGSEDDDLYHRLKHHGVHTTRSESEIGRYVEIHNRLGFVNPRRHAMVAEGKGLYSEDGLVNMNYSLTSLSRTRLYTNITITINQPDPFS